jgi:predicted RNase H-like HicB family nuclease
MTDELQDAVHVVVEYYDGSDAEDGDEPYYVASCEELAVTTGGKTFEELIENIRDAIQLHLKDEDTEALYHLSPNPRIILKVELEYAPFT